MASPFRKFTRRLLLALAVAWSLVIAGAKAWGILREQEVTHSLAIAQARAGLGKDKALRHWLADHHRVYVPVDERIRPHPRLAHLPDRDLTTPGGLKLTLIDPVTLINELDSKYGHLYGTTARITSLASSSPHTRPDPWERSALQQLQQGAGEVLAFVPSAHGPLLRLMQPLITQPNCLVCHLRDGFQVGRPAGGLTVSVPLSPLLPRQRQAIRNHLLTMAGLWLVGMLGLAITAWIILRQSRTEVNALRQLQRSEARKSAILDNALDCIITIDEQDRILEFNPAAEATFGYRAEEILGRPVADLLVPPDLRQAHRDGLQRQVEKGQSRILNRRIETRGQRADGSQFPVELAITRFEEDGRIYFTAFLRDITRQSELAEELRRQASRDALTGLLNRRTFEQRLQETVNQSDAPLCLLYLDLDRFKLVNDTGGHRAGDELLKQLAVRMRQSVGSHGIMGRLGGDEFGVVLPGGSEQNGRDLAQRLIDTVTEFRFYWEERIFTLGLSVGIVHLEQPRLEASQLLSHADAACYRAKEEGRNRYHLYSLEDRILNHRRSELDRVKSIQKALREERFELYAQPIVPLHRQVPARCCLEILLRMRGEDGECIAPDRFIPTAERHGLMPALDRWVVTHTLEWLAEQPALQLVSLNLSAASLNDSCFLEFLHDILDTHAELAGRLCLEITETEAITSLSRTRDFIDRLKALGCRFALDDFGSGMASYGYLQDLPVDFLKIDGRFVRRLDHDPVSRAMVRSIHELGRLMGKHTIAEFVVNPSVLEVLERMGIDYAQGFHLGEPMPLTSLTKTAECAFNR